MKVSIFIINKILTKASAKAHSASLLCCSIRCAITGREAGLIGGLSLPLLFNLLKLVPLVGLVSLEVSLEPVVDLGIPEDNLRGLGDDSWSIFPRYPKYPTRELGDPDLLVAVNRIFLIKFCMFIFKYLNDDLSYAITNKSIELSHLKNFKLTGWPSNYNLK